MANCMFDQLTSALQNKNLYINGSDVNKNQNKKITLILNS